MGSELRFPGREPAAVAEDRLRLLFAVPFGPRFDNHHGGKVVAHLVAHLADRHDVGVVYLTAPGERPIDPQLAARCALVRSVELAHGWAGDELRHRFYVLSTPFTRRPTQVANVYSRRLLSTVREITASWKPDVVQVEHDSLGYCAASLAGVDLARVLVCHDPGLKASEDLAHVTARRQRRSHLLDVASWRAYWDRMLPNFDAVVTFTDEDAAVLRPYVPGTIARIPLAIEPPQKAASALGNGMPSVLFVGAYSHPPNADAALRLIRSIMPRVRQRLPGLRLALVGDGPTTAMLHDAGPNDRITGSVPDVSPFVDDASLIALPIRIGGGMRVKLMEALGAGKAVVASPIAAAGLDAGDGRELLIADSDEEFADAIFALLAGDGVRMRLARSAREWALRNLAVPDRVSDYERLYRSLRASRS